MAVSNYSYTNLRDAIVDPIRYDNIGSVITTLNIINRAARMVVSDIDLRSTKRKVALASKLFDDIYSFASPSDLKGDAIIDIIPQKEHFSRRRRTSILQEEEFELIKETVGGDSGYLCALATDDLVNRLLFNGDVEDTALTIASFDSLTADGGTWALFGDAENVAQDTDQYIQGGGSVRFDISSAAGTTAGLQNASLDTFDITDYVDNGSVFVWVYINSVADTGSDGLTNFIIRIGNDSSNYYTQTITTTHDSTAFTAGWNLLRFDFVSMTQTGTVTATTCDYVAIYMTKETGKADNGYRFDFMTLHTGEYHNILYYSKYPWQSSAGAFIENSTTSTDLINADTDELELYVFKGKEEMYKELKEFDMLKIAQMDYQLAKKNYEKKNPSQRLSLIQRPYYKLGSRSSNGWGRMKQ